MGLSSKDVAAATAAEDMTFHWSQIGGELDMAAKPPSTGQASPRKQPQPQPQPPVVLKCPRCKSSNTKFCYYNNYSRTQPRHFCRACKRHWTEGGTLRNVPVGGSSGRKNNKRARTTKSSNVDSHQHQQQEVAASAAAPFGLQLDNEFTDTLRQLVCQQQQQQQQFPSSLLPLPSDYTDIEQVCAPPPPPPPYDPGNPFSNAAPPPLCSTGLELAGDDNPLLCPSKWLQEPMPQMQQLSYWNFWDFGIADLSTHELLGQAEGLQ